jgi:hypothetical protein
MRRAISGRALGDLLSRVPVGEKTLKFSARFALEHDLRWPVHQATNESHSRRSRIQMFVTEHYVDLILGQ